MQSTSGLQNGNANWITNGFRSILGLRSMCFIVKVQGERNHANCNIEHCCSDICLRLTKFLYLLRNFGGFRSNLSAREMVVAEGISTHGDRNKESMSTLNCKAKRLVVGVLHLLQNALPKNPRLDPIRYEPNHSAAFKSSFCRYI